MPDTEKIQDKATKDVSRNINKIIQDTVRDVSDDLNTVQNMVLGIDTTVTTAYATNLLTTANAYADSSIVNAITTANSHTDIHVLIITTSIVNSITTANAYADTRVANGITTSNAYTDALGIDDLLPAQSGKSGQYLTTNATSSSWAAVSGGASNVIFCWNGQVDYTTYYTKNSIIPDGSATLYEYANVYSDTLRTIFTSKFVKISGISTVTIYARIWSDNAAKAAYLKVDIGGANNTVTRTGNGVAWATAATIDVSGLTNGTAYDITIQLRGDAAIYGCCGAVILIGS